MDIFQTTKNQINRHIMDSQISQILYEAKTQIANEHYSLPYEFINDSQRLSLIDSIAERFAELRIQHIIKQTNKNLTTWQLT